MEAVHACIVGAYGGSCALAMFASVQTFRIARRVPSGRLKVIWLAITIVGAAVEVLHAAMTFYIAGISDTSSFAASAIVLMAAGGIFVCMALLMRVSMDSALQVPVLRQLAFCDALTKVGNRRAFDEALAHRAGRGGRGVILVDIDHFKGVNDAYGHEIGDLVLKHVAGVIETCSRGNPVFRIGGEEFGILVPAASEDARVLAETCRATVERVSLLHMGRSIASTVSIGVAESGEEEPAASLMRRADQALYAAKRAGRNRVVVHAQLDGRQDDRTGHRPAA